MSRKLAAILWAAKVLFIFCFIISLPIVFWYTTDAKETMTYTYKGILAGGGAWDFITRNTASFFFYGFVFTLMLLIYRHNRKRVSQDRAADSEIEDGDWLIEKPNLLTDPNKCSISGNIYHSPDMHGKE